MTSTDGRAVSGRALVIGSLVVVALVVLAGLVLGPPLRQDVLQEEGPRTLREPVATGIHRGDPWEAVARYDGTANCVELRYRGEVLDRACDRGPRRLQTSIPDGGPRVAYGIAAEDATRIEVALDDGSSAVAPVVAGDLGFPVGFWALKLPPGASLAGDGSR